MIFYAYIRTKQKRIFFIVLILSNFMRESSDTSSLLVASRYLNVVSMDAVVFYNLEQRQKVFARSCVETTAHNTDYFNIRLLFTKTRFLHVEYSGNSEQLLPVRSEYRYKITKLSHVILRHDLKEGACALTHYPSGGYYALMALSPGHHPIRQTEQRINPFIIAVWTSLA